MQVRFWGTRGSLPVAPKAQAVTARTYAVTTNVGGRGFDQYPDTRSQMYRGYLSETPSTAFTDAISFCRMIPRVTGKYFFTSSTTRSCSPLAMD